MDITEFEIIPHIKYSVMTEFPDLEEKNIIGSLKSATVYIAENRKFEKCVEFFEKRKMVIMQHKKNKNRKISFWVLDGYIIEDDP